MTSGASGQKECILRTDEKHDAIWHHVAGKGLVQLLALQKPHIPASFSMCLVINKCVTAVKVSYFSGHYLRNRSILDIGVLGYIGIVQHKEHSPEVLSIPPGTPCI